MTNASPIESRRAAPLKGTVAVPGDKSISHRALMLAGLAVGETAIEGLLEGTDVLATARAMATLGVDVRQGEDGVWRVSGVGVGGCREPEHVLDLGNAGTAARLLMGIAATHPFTTHFTGDASLCSRPMERVAEPLALIGARIVARHGCRLPLAVIGCESPVPVSYEPPVPSAQVKSAVLLAALNAPGETTVVEPIATRDHTERLLRHFGAELRRVDREDGGGAITLVGQPELGARSVAVPGDPSSAAFLVAAALVVPGSSLSLPNVGVNDTRTGLFTTLREMGADIEMSDCRDVAGEPVADLRVRSSALSGVSVPAARAPAMIDEYPIVAVAASFARGETVLNGVGELRFKESDRLDAIASGLKACGVAVGIDEDSLVVGGCDGPPPGGGRIETRLDHRIAMAFLVLGMASRRPVAIDDAGPIGTSFPGFVEQLNRLGASIV